MVKGGGGGYILVGAVGVVYWRVYFIFMMDMLLLLCKICNYVCL
jgi:hypothetical protein